jgi:hypothetical protein
LRTNDTAAALTLLLAQCPQISVTIDAEQDVSPARPRILDCDCQNWRPSGGSRFFAVGVCEGNNAIHGSVSRHIAVVALAAVCSNEFSSFNGLRLLSR